MQPTICGMVDKPFAAAIIKMLMTGGSGGLVHDIGPMIETVICPKKLSKTIIEDLDGINIKPVSKVPMVPSDHQEVEVLYEEDPEEEAGDDDPEDCLFWSFLVFGTSLYSKSVSFSGRIWAEMPAQFDFDMETLRTTDGNRTRI